MQGTAPDRQVLELFSLARSRLDAPLLTTFLQTTPPQDNQQQQPGAAGGPAAAAGSSQQQPAGAASAEVTRVMASIAMPNTVKIHQMAKSVLQERNDSRRVGPGSTTDHTAHCMWYCECVFHGGQAL